MADTIIQSLRDYFLTCPLMGDSAINVDYLPEGPAGGIFHRYHPGHGDRKAVY